MPEYIIKVDKPCSANWKEMSPGEMGRFCSSCEKTVIDFSRLSNEQIIELIRNSKTGLCGLLPSNQPLRIFVPEPVRSKWVSVNLLNGLLLLSSASASFSNTLKPHVHNIVEPHFEDVSFTKGHSAEKTKPGTHTLRGKVVDSADGSALIGAKVVVEANGRQITTDVNGDFSIELDEKLAKRKFVITVSYLGYQTKTITVMPGTFIKNLKIKLSASTFILGEIAVIER